MHANSPARIRRWAARTNRFLQPNRGSGVHDSRIFEREIHAAAFAAPFANVAHLVAIVMVGLYIIPTSIGISRLAWIAAGSGLAAFTFIAWIPKSLGATLDDPVRVRRQLLVVSFLFGVLWAVGAAVCASRVDETSSAILTVALAGVVGAGAMVLSSSRAVALTWVLGISTGSGFAQATADTRFGQLQAVETVLYVLALSIGIVYLSGSFRARCLAEYSADDERQKVSLLLDEFESGSRDWIWETRGDGTLSHVSTELADATQLPAEQLQAWTLPHLVRVLGVTDSAEGRRAYDQLLHHLSTERTFDGLVIPLVVGERQRWWSLSGRLRAGAGSGWRGIGADVTAAREARDHIDRIARTDALSGLPNRYAFNLKLESLLSNSHAGDTIDTEANAPVYLAILDVDHFKGVNDTLGHPMGDQLLVQIARALDNALRPDEFCARLGGDEFGIIIPDRATGYDAAFERYEHLRSLVTDTTFTVQGNLIDVTSSLGFVSTQQTSADPQELVVAADLALYAAKDAGRNRIYRFSDEMGQRSAARTRSRNDLASGIARHEFELFYQPQVDLHTNVVNGFEALLRWRHPELGLLMPTEFIDVAEETGLIIPLGQEVLTLVCHDVAAWPDQLRVSVNVSPRELLSSTFTARLTQELDIAQLRPERLTIEITESTLIDPGSIATLVTVRDLGMSISIDDFGTGYSSLTQLQRTPVRELKIDRSFVEDMAVDGSASEVIVDTVIRMANALGLDTVAEGVETTNQRDRLLALGCRNFQGYLEAEPMPAAEVLAYLKQRDSPTSPPSVQS